MLVFERFRLANPSFAEAVLYSDDRLDLRTRITREGLTRSRSSGTGMRRAVRKPQLHSLAMFLPRDQLLLECAAPAFTVLLNCV